MASLTGARVRAPELAGRGGWLNTGGRRSRSPDLRGKFVLLDFWTFCCINCLHVLDELRPLEEKYADVLVVVGVHSPKFVHEADHDAVVAAVERYEVDHPVLDDPDLVDLAARTPCGPGRRWRSSTRRATSSRSSSGEGHAHAHRRAARRAGRRARGQGHAAPRRRPVRPAAAGRADAALPGQGRRRCPTATLLVADAGHHSLVELAPDGETLVRRIGIGERGLVDGAPATARFNEPNGLCLLPDDVAPRSATTSWSPTPSTTRCAASARRRRRSARSPAPARSGCRATRAADGDARGSSRRPWDVAWWRGPGRRVAMAGIHQLWTFDPGAGDDRAVRRARRTRACVDGPARRGLVRPDRPGSRRADGDDGSGSPTPRRPACAAVRGTASCTPRSARGCSTSATATGRPRTALLQHPLGVTRAARRVGRGARHLQRRRTPLRPGRPARSRRSRPASPSRQRRAGRRRRTAQPARRRVGGAPADPGPAAGRRLHGRRLAPTARSGRRTEVAPGGRRARGGLRAAAGPEARRPLRPVDPAAGRRRHPPELLVERRRQRHRAVPRAGAGSTPRSRTACCTSPRSRPRATTATSVEFPACHVHQQDWGVPGPALARRRPAADARALRPGGLTAVRDGGPASACRHEAAFTGACAAQAGWRSGPGSTTTSGRWPRR